MLFNIYLFITIVCGFVISFDYDNMTSQERNITLFLEIIMIVFIPVASEVLA